MTAAAAEHLAHLLAVQSVQLAAVVPAVALLVATLLRRRPHLAYALWLVALAKCLVPPVWSSPTGLFSWAAAERPVPAHISPLPSDTPVIPPPVATVHAAVASPSPSNAASAEPSIVADRRPFPWPAVIVATWLTGSAAVLTATLLASAQLGRRLRASAVPLPADLDAMAEEIRRKLGLRRRVRLALTDADLGPALVGTWRPTVVLPARLLSAAPTDLRAVLAHELSHLRRGDAAVAAVQRLAVALWWFHPLVWLMSTRLTAAREQCCDEEAVAGLALDPLAYAQTLIDVVRHRRRALALSLCPGVHALRLTTTRLRRLMSDGAQFRRRPPPAAWAAGALAAALVLPGAGPTSRPASVTADGPATDGRTATATMTPAASPARALAASGRPLTLHGSVCVKGTHRPVAYAAVTIEWIRHFDSTDESSTGAYPPVQAKTDLQGSYELTIPADRAADPDLSISAAVDHAGFGHVCDFDCVRPIDAAGPRTGPTALDLELDPCEGVTGIVLGPDGRPRRHVPVAAASPSLEFAGYTDHTLTDDAGAFRLQVAVGEPVRLLVDPADLAARPVDLGLGRRAGTISLLSGTPVVGQVVDGQGVPLSDVTVVVSDLLDPPKPSSLGYCIRTATTNGQGRFVIAPVAPGRYSIGVSHLSAVDEGRRPAAAEAIRRMLPVTVLVGDGGARVRFEPLPVVRVAIRVATDGGQPAPAPAFVICGKAGGGGVTEHTHAGANGTAEATVPVGVQEATLCMPITLLERNTLSARYRFGDGPIHTSSGAVPLGTLGHDVIDLIVIQPHVAATLPAEQR
jgi:beta-lactamase regulating signal transducer with metallopeptidase domain